MPLTSTDPPLAFQDHDHAGCCGGLIGQAETLAAERGARLTPVRRRVLEILLAEHRAFGAYEVLERLVRDGFGNQPPVAYRALDFLVDQGLAHRISRLNAFMACTRPGQMHTPAVLICRTCHMVAETPGTLVRDAIDRDAATAGFVVERTTVEALGLCPACQRVAA